jgi:uncharacterized protein (TIGR01777 family)
MKVLITGATGFVGKRLIEKLYQHGHTDISVLTRNPKRAEQTSPLPIRAFAWDPNKGEIDKNALENIDCVIHLAGESVAEGRWTQAKKDRILMSRVNGTKLIMKAIKESANGPKKIISASAIGIYGDRADELLTTESSHASSFLADVCKKWEDLIHQEVTTGLRKHSIRVGIVLGLDGGALKKMLPPFKAGVAGNLGDGKQFMSWIHRDDLVEQFIFLMENDVEQDVFNGVSPHPVDNATFTKVLGSVVNRPTLFPVPAFALKTIFGEMSEILLASQRVMPNKFLEHGFKFKFEYLHDALTDILKYDNKGEDVLERYQYFEKPKKQVFNFFSDEMNLEKITPPFLKFKVLGKNTDKIESGTLIDYKLQLRGIPFKWQTKINEFNEDTDFTDQQVKGPYSKWVHTHSFHEVGNGTLMKDKVVYKVPFGALGRAVAGYFVKKDVNNIFDYRRDVIKKYI